MLDFFLHQTIKDFRYSSVVVYGLRGRGKDLLLSNVIARRKESYISNLDYKCKDSQYIPLDFKDLCIKNNFNNFLLKDINYYEYPYQEGADIYISDCGIYLPCQYNDRLNKNYETFVPFLALSRHLGNCNVHYNTQSLNRVWDKLREQTDQYIYCKSCIYIKCINLVIQRIRFYEKLESAQNLERPPYKPKNIFSLHYSQQYQEYIKEISRIGKVESRLLIYFNKSNYDTRFFKELLKNGEIKK